MSAGVLCHDGDVLCAWLQRCCQRHGPLFSCLLHLVRPYFVKLARRGQIFYNHFAHCCSAGMRQPVSFAPHLLLVKAMLSALCPRTTPRSRASAKAHSVLIKTEILAY